MRFPAPYNLPHAKSISFLVWALKMHGSLVKFYQRCLRISFLIKFSCLISHMSPERAWALHKSLNCWCHFPSSLFPWGYKLLDMQSLFSLCLEDLIYNTTHYQSQFQMDKPCPNKLCNYTYKPKKKPFKCPSCDIFLGKELSHIKKECC